MLLYGCENYCFQEKALPSRSVKNDSLGFKAIQLSLSDFSVIAGKRYLFLPLILDSKFSFAIDFSF